jgi:Ser/Thr protein kinase RdoA (MazF antagonist)
VKPLEELTYLGQVRRMRRLAEAVLGEYGLDGARLTLLGHGENTTFRVDAPNASFARSADGPFAADRFLLRIHRPGYQTASSIVSELAWLSALRRDVQAPVPEPLPSLDGGFLITPSAPGVPDRRNCSLLRWLKGRKVGRRVRPRHFTAVGRLMAQLHGHAANWTPPTSFIRRHWDWEGLFGDDAGFNMNATQVWALVPQRFWKPFNAVASETREVMNRLGTGQEAFGLIHADLFLGTDGNVLISRGEARAIDFDDCGFGYWVYDFAVLLAHWQLSDEWPQIQAALLDGYTQVRPLEDELLVYLELFMAARHVSEILWALDMAQVHPGFRDALDGWLEWAGRHVRHYLELPQ